MSDKNATLLTLSSGTFSVEVDPQSLSISSYRLGNSQWSLGAKAQTDPVSAWFINGSRIQASTKALETTDESIVWETSVEEPRWGDLTITSTLSVRQNEAAGILEFQILRVNGEKASCVHQIALDVPLLELDGTNPTSALGRTKIDNDPGSCADQIICLGAVQSGEADSAPVSSPYTFMWDDQLSAAVFTTATPDLAADQDRTNFRTLTQVLSRRGAAEEAGTADETGVGVGTVKSGSWTWNPDGQWVCPEMALLQAKATVVIAPQDGDVDPVDLAKNGWQSAARVLRAEIPAPLGADRVPFRVASRIPFNFASQATNPFWVTLENVKRVANATAGLGQWLLLKGYGSEGHDSANSDYGGNYNDRAGGLGDLQALTKRGADYNADFCVHVNATEIYPQARAFTDELTHGASTRKWAWMGQSYKSDPRLDLGSGAIIERFSRLRQDCPNISGVYIDAYYQAGWVTEGLGKALRELSFDVASEYSNSFEGQSLWSHWANDFGYGATYGSHDNQGLNSKFIRFMFNHQRDVWNPDPLLGANRTLDFEGWTGKNDWNAYIANLWANNVPTKFLQRFPIVHWQKDRIVFESGVEARLIDGVRHVYIDGVLVSKGDSYLLPWPEQNGMPSRLYLYCKEGDQVQFQLPTGFADASKLYLYELDTLGATAPGLCVEEGVEVLDGKICLSVKPSAGYVLSRQPLPKPQNQDRWGELTLLHDPLFSSGTLDAWSPAGNVEAFTEENGRFSARFLPGEGRISQAVSNLGEGQYRLTFYCLIEAEQSAKPRLDVSVRGADGAELGSVSMTQTLMPLNLPSHNKNGSRFQKVAVDFAVEGEARGEVQVTLQARVSEGEIRVGDLWLSKSRSLLGVFEQLERSQAAGDWDFEDAFAGWGPFVRGDVSFGEDARTSITQLHQPFSQKEWKQEHDPFQDGGVVIDDVLTGSHSLKSFRESAGIVYRTSEGTFGLQPGKTYDCGFLYQSTHSGAYAWVHGRDTVEGTEILEQWPLVQTDQNAEFACQIRCAEPAEFVGLMRLEDSAGGAVEAEIVIDQVMLAPLSK